MTAPVYRLRGWLGVTVLAVTLVALLASGSYAAAKIDGSDIQKDSIPANRLVEHSVGSKQIEKGSIGGSRLKPNSVKGAKVDESSLGKVPAAERADLATNAVVASGHVLRSFVEGVGNNEPSETLLDFRGIRIEANCASSQPNPDWTNESDANITFMYSGMFDDTAGQDHAVGVAPLTLGDLGPDGTDTGHGTATWHWADGRLLTVVFGFMISDNICHYWGQAIAS